MKKLLCILLATLLLLCTLTTLGACGSGDKDGGAETTKEAQTTDKKTETTDSVTTGGTGTEGEDTKKPADSTGDEEFVLPEGYAYYNYKNIGFAHPDDFVYSDAFGNTLSDSASGTRIDFYTQDKTDLYDTISLEEYIFSMSTINEITGTTLSDVTIERKTNGNGIKVTIINQKAVTASYTEYQTKYIMTLYKNTYIITVGQETVDADLLDVIYRSFVEVA